MGDSMLSTLQPSTSVSLSSDGQNFELRREVSGFIHRLILLLRYLSSIESRRQRFMMSTLWTGLNMRGLPAMSLTVDTLTCRDSLLLNRLVPFSLSGRSSILTMRLKMVRTFLEERIMSFVTKRSDSQEEGIKEIILFPSDALSIMLRICRERLHTIRTTSISKQVKLHSFTNTDGRSSCSSNGLSSISRLSPSGRKRKCRSYSNPCCYHHILSYWYH